MNVKTLTILVVFTVLLIFSFVSRIFFNEFQDGWNAYEKTDYKTARELWLPLAEQGELRAQFFLGFMHDMGFGVPEDDKEAFKWYQLAAEQGDSRAQLFMGYMHDFGHGVLEDDQEAFKYFLPAAEQGYKKAIVSIYNLAQKNLPEALKVLKTDAESGDSKAQYALGKMYEFGRGVRQDYKEAIKWYQLSREPYVRPHIFGLAFKGVPEAVNIIISYAEAGHVDTQRELGVMYEFGKGVQQDYKEAVKWYQRAEKNGHKQAKEIIYNLARKNSPEALKILLYDAENGIEDAQSALSMMYQFGLGVPQDNKESAKWYRFAAERELAKAKKNVRKYLKVNIPQALKFLISNAENGNAGAQMELGLSRLLGLMISQDEIEAVKWFRLAIEQKSSLPNFIPKFIPEYIMGLVYSNGQGALEDDQEALKWYRLAEMKRIALHKNKAYSLAKEGIPQALKILTADAENGVSEAQVYLGNKLRFGFGAPKDEQKAAEWYRLAAESGNSHAQSILGLMYANGQGVPQDDQEAMKWYRLAAEKKTALDKNEIYHLAKNNVPSALKVLIADAENGIVDAQYILAAMHADGLGVQYDPVLAHMWYNLPALQGDISGASQIKTIEKKMSQQQIEQAQEMVRDWRPGK
jgi:TPR repeat protein